MQPQLKLIAKASSPLMRGEQGPQYVHTGMYMTDIISSYHTLVSHHCVAFARKRGCSRHVKKTNTKHAWLYSCSYWTVLEQCFGKFLKQSINMHIIGPSSRLENCLFKDDRSRDVQNVVSVTRWSPYPGPFDWKMAGLGPVFSCLLGQVVALTGYLFILYHDDTDFTLYRVFGLYEVFIIPNWTFIIPNWTFIIPNWTFIIPNWTSMYMYSKANNVRAKGDRVSNSTMSGVFEPLKYI